MKNLFLLGLFGLIYINGQAQELNAGGCGTDAYNESIFAANPSLQAQMHEHLLRVTSGVYSTDDRADECTIPVVVHVLHDDEIGDISFEQIQSGIDMLNADFNRENSDAGNTRNTTNAPFSGIASDMEILFELAKIDPEGNCTNGVERKNVGTQSYLTNNVSKHASSGGLDAWDINYYFNIWIVNSIDPEGFGVEVLYGYAEFPYSGGSSNYGIMIRNDYYGTTGTALGDRTLTHEVGHCLGLFHTFQNGCHATSCSSNGDYCCDTPPVSSPQWSCSTTQNTCSDVASEDEFGFDALDQFENFMSYSPCQNMFSEDQKTIVTNNFATIPFLISLVDPDHYTETGVGTPGILCKAEFSLDNRIICAGQTVTFNYESYANVTGRTWNFEGGTPATSTAENPTITYNTAGYHAVTLTATDGVSTVETNVENSVLVLPNPGHAIPHVEKFETISEIPDNTNFLVINSDKENTWEINNTIGYSGNQSVYIENFNTDNQSKDELISATIDLSNIAPDDPLIFSFRYAYNKRNENDDEWLRFFVSNNCGETWVLRKNIHGDALSENISSDVYAPASRDEWKLVEITTITSPYHVSNFRYKIQFENDNGNNIYIDDINVYPASLANTIEHKTNSNHLSVYPNPFSDQTVLKITPETNTTYTVSLYNSLGKKLTTIIDGVHLGGENEIKIPTNDLAKGIYFLRVKAGSKVQTIKLVKN